MSIDKNRVSLGDAEIMVRRRRNTELEFSDWTQTLDAPVNKEAWATYRQQLRDVTAQEGFPYDVIWPTPPQD